MPEVTQKRCVVLALGILGLQMGLRIWILLL